MEQTYVKILALREAAGPVRVVVTTMLLVLAGCSGDAASTSPVDDDNELVSLQGEQFWDSLAVLGADSATQFDSLAEIPRSGAIVIRGRVVGAGPGRVIRGDVAEDVLQLGELRVAVEEVVAGVLPVPPKDDVILVETLQVPATEPAATESVIMVLQWSPDVGSRDPQVVLEETPELRERYTLAGSQSVWIQGENGATSPLLSHEPPDVVAADPIVSKLRGRSLEEVERLIEAETAGVPAHNAGEQG